MVEAALDYFLHVIHLKLHVKIVPLYLLPEGLHA